MLDPVYVRAIRNAAKLRDKYPDLYPSRRKGRDASDHFLRDALMREAVSFRLEQGATKRQACLELAEAMPMIGLKAVEAVIYKNRDLFRKI